MARPERFELPTAWFVASCSSVSVPFVDKVRIIAQVSGSLGDGGHSRSGTGYYVRITDPVTDGPHQALNDG